MVLFDRINFAKNLLDPAPYLISISYTIYSQSNTSIHHKHFNDLMAATEALFNGGVYRRAFTRQLIPLVDSDLLCLNESQLPVRNKCLEYGIS